jgi:DNA-binding NarL/FixJ family response regulator
MTLRGPTRPFTKRQAEIADAIYRGLTDAEIAGELSRGRSTPISLHTVRAHIKSMGALLDDPPRASARKRIELWEWDRRHAERAVSSAP